MRFLSFIYMVSSILKEEKFSLFSFFIFFLLLFFMAISMAAKTSILLKGFIKMALGLFVYSFFNCFLITYSSKNDIWNFVNGIYLISNPDTIFSSLGINT